jgi:glycerophosphoryl diester phosphodiesterase
MIEQLKLCDESLDLILLPECCNAPSGCGDSSLLRRLVAQNTDALLAAVKETAIRCKATVGINLYVHGEGYETVVRNATLLYNSSGELAAQYDKQHLPVSEYTNDYIDHSYLSGSVNPCCAQVDGVRYAFLTCYDMYYAEFIHRISLEKPDVVLICSLQRAERPDILEMQGKNTAFVCNSYVVRSSYHMGSDAKTGACSMVVAPDGVVLRNFGQQLGSFDCRIEDIHWKYRRSNGFGQPEVTNDVYQTLFRTPWCYRVGGSGVLPDNKRMTFPRLSARRGFTPAAPENSLPGIGIAVALGASEIAIDIRATSDGVPVLSRDPDTLRLAGEQVNIRQTSYAELRKLNIGKQFASAYDGVTYATLEEVFATFPQRAIFNLRIQPDGTSADCRSLIRTILELAGRYDCLDHIYFSSEDHAVLAIAAELAPDVERCLIFRDEQEPVEAALKLGCTRIQTTAAYLTDNLIRQVKAANIRCNLHLANDPAQAENWLSKGIDCILTENFLTLSQSAHKH